MSLEDRLTTANPPAGEGPAGRHARRREDRNLQYVARRSHDEDHRPDAQNSLFALIWRHRVLVTLPLIVGMGIGWYRYQSQPELYRSTSKFLVSGQQSSILETASGKAFSAVPGADLLVAQLTSDQVLLEAVQHPALAEQRASMSDAALTDLLASRLDFQETTSSRGIGSSVFLLHFDHSNSQLAEAAVRALSHALEDYFRDRSESSVRQLTNLVDTAQNKLKPELDRLEEQYQLFRQQSELRMNSSGELVNPHRERQVSLQQRLGEIEEKARTLEGHLAAIEETAKSTEDPMIVLDVTKQLIGQETLQTTGVGLVTPAEKDNRTGLEDLNLQRLQIERSLVPLEVERDQLRAQFGEQHPNVKQLEQQVALTREKLEALTLQESERRKKLRAEQTLSENVERESKDRASRAVIAIVRAFRMQRIVLNNQRTAVETEIEDAANAAAELEEAENQDAMYRRKIQRHQGLLTQLEETMARVSLIDEKGGVFVDMLKAPSRAYLMAREPSQFLLIGAFVGAGFGIALAFLWDSQSKTFHRAEEIEETLNASLLAHLPFDDQKLPRPAKGKVYENANLHASLAVVHRPQSQVAEAIRRLRTAVMLAASTEGHRVLQVTSPSPGDGKSTISANLAVSLARTGKRVLLIDADLRRPALSEVLGLQEHNGLSELLDGCEPDDVLCPTPIENLCLIPSGDIPANPAEALTMPQFGELVRWTSQRFDHVIIDTPPTLVVSDPLIVSNYVDGVIFTFRIRRGCRPQAKEALAILRGARARILGLVVNHSDQMNGSDAYSAETDGYLYEQYTSKDRKGSGGRFAPRKENFVISSSTKGAPQRE